MYNADIVENWGSPVHHNANTYSLTTIHTHIHSYRQLRVSNINLHVFVLWKEAYYFLLLLFNVFNVLNSKFRCYTAFWRRTWPFNPLSISLSCGKQYVHCGGENGRPLLSSQTTMPAGTQPFCCSCLALLYIHCPWWVIGWCLYMANSSLSNEEGENEIFNT